STLLFAGRGRTPESVSLELAAGAGAIAALGASSAKAKGLALAGICCVSAAALIFAAAGGVIPANGLSAGRAGGSRGFGGGGGRRRLRPADHEHRAAPRALHLLSGKLFRNGAFVFAAGANRFDDDGRVVNQVVDGLLVLFFDDLGAFQRRDADVGGCFDFVE